MLTHVQLMSLPSIVEARLAIQREAHLAAYHPHQPNDLMMRGSLLRMVYGHKVNDLAHSPIGHEAGDQHCSFREIQLLGYIVVTLWRNPEISPAFPIE